VYVASLLAVYLLAGSLSMLKENTSPETLSKFLINKFQSKLFVKMVYRFVPPMLCYFFIVLVIPFLHNARQNDFKKFLEYATLITSVCFAMIFVSCIAYAVLEHLRGKK
jgi:hypothetical protein